MRCICRTLTYVIPVLLALGLPLQGEAVTGGAQGEVGFASSAPATGKRANGKKEPQTPAVGQAKGGRVAEHTRDTRQESVSGKVKGRPGAADFDITGTDLEDILDTADHRAP